MRVALPVRVGVAVVLLPVRVGVVVVVLLLRVEEPVRVALVLSLLRVEEPVRVALVLSLLRVAGASVVVVVVVRVRTVDPEGVVEPEPDDRVVEDALVVLSPCLSLGWAVVLLPRVVLPAPAVVPRVVLPDAVVARVALPLLPPLSAFTPRVVLPAPAVVARVALPVDEGCAEGTLPPRSTWATTGFSRPGVQGADGAGGVVLG